MISLSTKSQKKLPAQRDTKGKRGDGWEMKEKGMDGKGKENGRVGKGFRREGLGRGKAQKGKKR